MTSSYPDVFCEEEEEDADAGPYHPPAKPRPLDREAGEEIEPKPVETSWAKQAQMLWVAPIRCDDDEEGDEGGYEPRPRRVENDDDEAGEELEPMQPNKAGRTLSSSIGHCD